MKLRSEGSVRDPGREEIGMETVLKSFVSFPPSGPGKTVRAQQSMNIGTEHRTGIRAFQSRTPLPFLCHVLSFPTAEQLVVHPGFVCVLG